MAKPPILRTKSATTKVTEAEYDRLEALAEASGVNLSEWMRGRLLGPDTADRQEEAAILLSEVLALRDDPVEPPVLTCERQAGDARWYERADRAGGW